MIFLRFFGALGLFFVAALGAATGSWVVSDTKPVKFLARRVLTPVVKPGDNVEVELENYRDTRCPQVVYKYLTYPNSKRDSEVRPLPENFGVLGLDKYVTEMRTKSQDVPYGKAYIYTYTDSSCNPYQWWVPQTSGPWIDEFEFGPETKRLKSEDAPNSLARK